MKPGKPGHNAMLLLMVLAFGLTGCASLTVDEHAPLSVSPSRPDSDIERADVIYQVKRNDSLSAIALRLTGKISNWQPIATRNDIDNPRDLDIGKLLIIPAELIEQQDARSQGTIAKNGQVMDISDFSTNGLPEIAIYSSDGDQSPESDFSGNSTALRTTASPAPTLTEAAIGTKHRAQDSVNSEGSSDVMVAAVARNRTFDLLPIERPFSADRIDQRDTLLDVPRIRVTGTYFPKGIYALPVSHSQLVERATPGTYFQLDNALDGWYRIITDRGFAYIRQSDSTLVW